MITNQSHPRPQVSLNAIEALENLLGVLRRAPRENREIPCLYVYSKLGAVIQILTYQEFISNGCSYQ